MKTLMLMRHGKSSWKNGQIDDHERPLKKRGRKDTKRVAKWIAKKGLTPDLILCSSAVRARQTVEVIHKALAYEGETRICQDLYEAEPQDYVAILKLLDDRYKKVLIVAHNPAIETYLRHIDEDIQSVPTAGLGYLTLTLDSWQALSLQTMVEFVGFIKPKALKNKTDLK